MEPTDVPPMRAAAAGELVVLNGRQSGVRRALGVPTTFIGSAAGCDVRLNVEGVEPFHCVLTYHRGAASVRDLNSARGTFVNGQRITAMSLRDGDLLDVGPFRFRVLLPAPRPTAAVMLSPAAEREALRIQAAAVAAQQAALDEQEGQLQQQREHLTTQAERLAKRSATLDRVRSELQYQEGDLAIQQLRLNTVREVDTRLLQDGWRSLQDDQHRWRRRRTRESTALRARRLLLIDSERKLAELRTLILREKAAWEAHQQTLHAELHGLNNRIIHQRQRLHEQEELRQTRTVRPAAETPSGPPLDAALVKRSAVLDHAACALADQRAELVEQWERLARLQRDWEIRRDQTTGELETLGQRLARREETLAAREQEIEAAEGRQRQQHEQLDQLRREAALARARTQAQQQAWQADREAVLEETARLSEQARRQLEALAKLRRSWSQRRRKEAEALARSLQQQRQMFAGDSETLAALQQELGGQAEQLARAQSELLERQTALEVREATLAAGEARLEQDVRQSEQRRWNTERQLVRLQEETEHLARALIADAEPQPTVLERAA